MPVKMWTRTCWDSSVLSRLESGISVKGDGRSCKCFLVSCPKQRRLWGDFSLMVSSNDGDYVIQFLFDAPLKCEEASLWQLPKIPHTLGRGK